MELDDLLKELKGVLREELEHEEILKEISERKKKLVDKLEPFINTDSYSNKFVRLQRKYTLVIDPSKVPDKYTDMVKRVTDEGRREIEKTIAFGKEIEGVKYLQKLICYKKKDGLKQ